MSSDYTMIPTAAVVAPLGPDWSERSDQSGSITQEEYETRQDKTKTKTQDMSTKAYAWCFTAFKEEHLDPILACEGVKVMVIAKEVAPSTGREHWQGYVRFGHQCRLGGLVLKAPGVHWEPRRGSEAQAVAYIKDVETYNKQHPMQPPKEQGDVVVVRGTPSVTVPEGIPKPLERAARMIANGAPLWQVHKEIGPFTFMMNAQKLNYYAEMIKGWQEAGVDYE